MSLDFRFEMFIFKPAVSKTGKRVDSEKAAMPEIGDKSTLLVNLSLSHSFIPPVRQCLWCVPPRHSDWFFYGK